MDTTKLKNALPSCYRVLLVEESPIDAALIVAMLHKDQRSFEVTQKKSLLEADQGALFADFEVALVSLASSLDLSSGLPSDALAFIRRTASQIPTIVLTEVADIDVFNSAIEAGAQDCIQRSDFTALRIGRDIERAVIRHRFAEDLALRGERASEASKAKTNFVSAMSHEIRTPLNALLGVAELLENSSLNPEQSSYVRVFRRSGQSLLSLINGTLDLASIERGKFELIVSQFSIRELVEDVAENFAYAAHKKGLALIVDLAPEVVELVEGDAERIRQILINLVSNAIKFTQAGHVSLRVRQDEHDFIVFEVRDSGIGVDPAKLQTIFAPFEQAKHDPEHVYGGTGLGLALCQGLAERMGGTIEAKPTTIPGAQIELRLPLIPKAARPPQTKLRSAGRALAVVTCPEEFVAIERFCNRAGVLVDGAASSTAAVEKLRTSVTPYDYLIADCRVPDGGGLSIIDSLQGLSHQPNMMILLPMDHRPGDTAIFEKVGAASMIKPVREQRLVKWLHGDRSAGASTSNRKVEHTSWLPKGLRILHADDSADNRLLVNAYLRNSGAEITEVYDGIDAVEKFVTGEFDVVLMDVLMPRMDGLEATRRIRDFESREGRSPTPIIALTANAFSEQIEHCMRAGTTLHISKPMSQGMLLDGLATVLDLEETPMTMAVSHPERAAQPIDPSLIDPDILPLLPDYLERRAAEATKLQSQLAQREFESLRIVGHNLKGTGAGYGLPEITEIGSRIEEAAKGSEADALAQDIALLDRVIEAAQEAIRGFDSRC
ncbi:MAG: response regulator [Myxococcota bacterium]